MVRVLSGVGSVRVHEWFGRPLACFAPCYDPELHFSFDICKNTFCFLVKPRLYILKQEVQWIIGNYKEVLICRKFIVMYLNTESHTKYFTFATFG